MRPRPKRKLRGGSTWLGVLTLLMNGYKKSAARRNHLWELSQEQAESLFKGNCVYCGSPPTQNLRGHLYNGIDRVDNSKGYAPTNVVSACGYCNMAKRGNSVQEFFAWIERLTQYHGQRHVPSEPKFQDSAQVPKRPEEASCENHPRPGRRK